MNIMKFKQKAYLPVESSDEEEPVLEKYSSHDEDNSCRSSSSTIHGSRDSTSQHPKKRINVFSSVGESAQSALGLLCLFIINLAFTWSNVYWNHDARVWEKSMNWWCPITPHSKRIFWLVVKSVYISSSPKINNIFSPLTFRNPLWAQSPRQRQRV